MHSAAKGQTPFRRRWACPIPVGKRECGFAKKRIAGANGSCVGTDGAGPTSLKIACAFHSVIETRRLSRDPNDRAQVSFSAVHDFVDRCLFVLAVLAIAADVF